MAWSLGTFTRTNGTYTGNLVWTNDAQAAIKIEAARHDTHDQDLAAGINACLHKGGQNAPTADIGWGGYKITSLGNGASAQDAATVAQTVTGASWSSTTGVLTLTRTTGNITVDISSALDAQKLGGQLPAFYAPIDSAALTGTPTAPTAAGGDNSTKIANTAFVAAAIASGGGGGGTLQPPLSVTSSRALTGTDVNRIIEVSSASAVFLTLPAGVGANGDLITIVNSSSSAAATITRSGTSLFRYGINQDLSIPARRTVTIYRSATSNTWYAL